MPRRVDRRMLLRLGMAAAPLLGRPSASGQAARHRVTLPKTVRVGIIGLEGHFGEVTAAAEILPQIKITAVAVGSDREAALARQDPDLSAARLYSDYEAMLEAQSLDVVCVCNEHGDRARVIVACARRGVAVAAEKPLAVSLRELEAVKAAVAESGIRLTMLLPMRFSPPYLAMRAAVERGEIGEPVALSGQKSYQLGDRPEWMKHRPSYGGTIPHIAVHVVDLLRFISGREMVEAAAFHSNVGLPGIGEMENNATLSYRLDNGGTASVRLDYLRPMTAGSHGDDRLRIAGTKGIVEYEHGQVHLVTATQKPHQVTKLPEHTLLFADFLDSIYNGKRHLLPLEDAYRVTEIVLRTREAADTRRVVKL